MVTNTELDHILTDLVDRLVESLHPRRIVLFGSAARGQMSRDSDIDVLIVMPDTADRRQTLRTAGRALFGLGRPKDIVVATEDDIRRYGDDPSLVIGAALREGREIYSAS